VQLFVAYTHLPPSKVELLTHKLHCFVVVSSVWQLIPSA
jgi:hypothetical protein